MSATTRIQAVLNVGILMPDFVIVPGRGATLDEIREEEMQLGRRLCPDHVEILATWNGIALEVVRLFGCGTEASEIGRISSFQLPWELPVHDSIVVASDASGFLYIQSPDQRIYTFDTDGGDFEESASNLDDFFERLVFGEDAASFAGKEWLDSLRAARIIE